MNTVSKEIMQMSLLYNSTLSLLKKWINYITLVFYTKLLERQVGNGVKIQIQEKWQTQSFPHVDILKHMIIDEIFLVIIS